MTKKIHKSAVLMMLLFGLLFVTTAPNAMAQGNCRKRGGYSAVYDQGRYVDGRRFNNDRFLDRRFNDRNFDRRYYDDRYDREATTGNAVKRTALGAGIGALGGALLGGKKGALIGAGAGAGAGYIYHRVKVDRQRDRNYRY
ncbi:MAG: YMGG-like glycine zipper-containing protein [Acidobacteria bacterium]|nr:YMGG-like glycine zipper-containing protein [Acidobacteriota bacterium]